jgi:anti-sigma regulatory factor (Ser/Thr protein kinase)
MVAVALADAGHDDRALIDRMQLVTSELVTNAIVHAGTDIQVRVRTDDGAIRLEVADGARGRPRRLSPSPTDTGGRGLLLVDALVDAWGISEVPGGGGKTVWIRVQTP